MNTPDYTILNKEDFKVLQKRKNSKSIIGFFRDKQRRYPLIVLSITSVISLIIIFFIISFWRSTTDLNSKYSELLTRYNLAKVENQQLYQTLGNEIKEVQEIQHNQDAAQDKKKSLLDKYDQLQKENVLIIKELTDYTNKEEEIKVLTKSLKDQRTEYFRRIERELSREHDTFRNGFNYLSDDGYESREKNRYNHRFEEFSSYETPWNPGRRYYDSYYDRYSRYLS